MKKAYNEILNEMKNAFYEKSGENVEKYSELETRFKAVASEIFSLYCRGDYILRQAFVQTAEGEYLDRHAALRGITRKSASKAKLMLTFYLNEPSEEMIAIEEGCICACADRPFIQFETTEDGILFPGDTSVTVEAVATESGSSHNVGYNTVTVIVNPPLGVSGVTNDLPFEAGFDDESDGMLRKRILEAYSVPSTGYSLLSIREAVCGVDGVLDCRASFDDGVLTLAVKTVTGVMSTAIRRKIEDRLLAAELFAQNTEIKSATKKSISLKAEVKCSLSEHERIRQQVKDRLSAQVAALRVGELLSLSSAAYSASGIDGVEFCEVNSEDSIGGLILCEADEYLYLDGVEVNFYE